MGAAEASASSIGLVPHRLRLLFERPAKASGSLWHCPVNFQEGADPVHLHVVLVSDSLRGAKCLGAGSSD